MTCPECHALEIAVLFFSSGALTMINIYLIIKIIALRKPKP